MELGERIKQLRAASRFATQKELADAAGVHVTALSHWESGRREPRRAGLEALAAALGVPVSAFFTEAA